MATGPLPEIIEPGLTGYLAQSEEELTQAVESLRPLDRRVVRERVAARFDLPIIAGQYIELYRQMRASA